MREWRNRPLWLSGGSAADRAGEAEFSNRFYPVCWKIAGRVKYRFPSVLPVCDLCQEGMIAALALYRVRGSAPPVAMACIAAKRQMIDRIRALTRPGRVLVELEDCAGDCSEVARVDRAVLAGKLLEFAGDSRDRLIIARHCSGQSLKLIARDLGITEGRVSQLRKAALARIRVAV